MKLTKEGEQYNKLIEIPIEKIKEIMKYDDFSKLQYQISSNASKNDLVAAIVSYSRRKLLQDELDEFIKNNETNNN